MSVTLAGMVTDVRPRQSHKADAAIVVTPSGMMSFPVVQNRTGGQGDLKRLPDSLQKRFAAVGKIAYLCNRVSIQNS